ADQREPFTVTALPIGAAQVHGGFSALPSDDMEAHLLTTPVPDLPAADFRRCGGVLSHIYSLAEDGEWLCHLPDGHDDVCRAPDGTTW
ncbi:MAG: hypothetical protein ACRDRY_11455, partial [Pseudonocardiaceae bacterium]